MSDQPEPVDGDTSPDDPTVLGMSRADLGWTYALLGGGGLLLFLAAPWLAGWLAEVPFVPFHGVLDAVASFDQPWAWVVRPLVGLLLGLTFAFFVAADEHRLEVDRDRVVVVHDADRRTLDRHRIAGVHLDGKKVVIDGTHGGVLFEKRVESRREDVRAAFVGRGYPWESQ